MSDFKPNLAATIKDVTELVFPLYVSPKLDGIRCVVLDGEPLTRSLKPIPNLAIREALSRSLYTGLDGELIVGSHKGEGVLNRSSSGVMGVKGEPDWRYHVFDSFNQWEEPFQQRYADYQDIVGDDDACRGRICSLTQQVVTTLEEFLIAEAHYVSEGYEGVMARSPYTKYKFGRSTMKEQGLMKLKRWTDDEAEIEGYEEMMHNANESFKDELGRTKRSTHQENKVGLGTLGALKCKHKDGSRFNIGTGMDRKMRDYLWSIRAQLPGQFVKYKSIDYGVKDAPRSGVFIALRNRLDMSS